MSNREEVEQNSYGVLAFTLEECLHLDISYYYESLPIKVNIYPKRFPVQNSTFFLNVQSEERILFSFFFPFSVTPCYPSGDIKRLHTLDYRNHYPQIRDKVLMELKKFLETDDEDDE